MSLRYTRVQPVLISSRDEVMYQARLHPEQYSNTFTDEQIERLHKAIMYVCDTAIEVNADSSLFPKDWLMNHRWSKGKETKLPTGEKVTFLKVGGRTSAIVPSLQKKTAAVAGDVSGDADADEAGEADEEAKPKKKGKKVIELKQEEAGVMEPAQPAKPKRGRKKAETEEEAGEETKEQKSPATKKQKLAATDTSKKGKRAKKEEVKEEAPSGRRRSTRLSK